MATAILPALPRTVGVSSVNFGMQRWCRWGFLNVSCGVPFLVQYSVGFHSLGPEVLDEEGTQEDLEYKLKGLIDLTLDKR